MTARLTPYEHILAPLEATLFPAIREEGEQRGSDTRRRDQFLLLANAGLALREMMPDDAPAEALDEYGELLYQGFQFWSFGRRLYVFGEVVTAQLLAARYPLDGWTLAAPPACYLQLPYQRLWARVATDAPFEPVDGCFVLVDDTEPRPDAGAHLRVQLVLGLRPERPGISLVSYRTDLDPARAAARAAAPQRDSGAAFANAIPGGERQGYHTLLTTAELEAFAIRALAYLDRNPRSLKAHEGSEGEEGKTELRWIEVGEAVVGV